MIVTTMDFHKLHREAYAVMEEKSGNFLQNNDRIQNTEAAADFKAFQVAGTLLNSKPKSWLFNSSSWRRTQKIQSCTYSSNLAVHFPFLDESFANMASAIWVFSIQNNWQSQKNRQIFHMAWNDLSLHILVKSWAGFTSPSFSNGISSVHIIFSALNSRMGSRLSGHIYSLHTQ